MTYRKKLIEVSLPLEAINKEAAYEKSIHNGHPSSLHLWWARRPLAACRAVLFSSLVDDPSEYMPDEESSRIERERLFGIIEDLVLWENSNNEEVLDKAKMEIARSVARNLNVDVPVGKEAVREFLATKAPPIMDPFAGGGSIPLEAQRLGLRAYASDLNPVAVLINKALIEIPPRFANMSPLHPPVKSGDAADTSRYRAKHNSVAPEFWAKEWKGTQGLTEDVRYYGKWLRDEAFKRIGHLYPFVTITKEMLAERPDLKEQELKVGDQLTVIAWLWTRTVKCPNPACGIQMPLLNTLTVCDKKGRKTFVRPIIANNKITYKITKDEKNLPEPPKKGRGISFSCLSCGQIAGEEYIKSAGLADDTKFHLIDIVTDGKKGRIHISPDSYHEKTAREAIPNWKPMIELSRHPQYMAPPRYKMEMFADLFTSRQTVALSTLSDLVKETYDHILEDLKLLPSNHNLFSRIDYAQAICMYLGMNVSRQANRMSTLSFWDNGAEKIQQVFSRQAYTMNWIFPEANPFSSSSGNFIGQLDYLTSVLENLPLDVVDGIVEQKDAVNSEYPSGVLASTDPPYYDNVPYADLSDFFYIWLRKSLTPIIPALFKTMLVPKGDELVADNQRHGSKQGANQFFENGLRSVFSKFKQAVNPEYPLTVYYAFKQAESEENENSDQVTASTGWETMLESLLSSGFSIVSTWPMHTEQATNIKKNLNALASSIILVCHPRLQDAANISRREFLSTLKRELSPALRRLQQGSIAPVDLAQASIGPGMAIYSRYKAVLEADGKPMSVRTALGLINQALDEFLAEQEGEYDGDTRWALTWFEQFGHNEAAYGVAETLSRAKNTSVEGLSEAGIVEARGGKVRLYRRDELDTDWDPTQDKRLTAWESAAHLIYALENGGEESAAELLAKLGPVAEVARDLAYRLYTVCERKGWSQDALGYNMLVVAWPRLKELAARRVEPGQGKLM